MKVNLSSQDREIIASGTVFLFSEDADFTLRIELDDSSEIKLSVLFKNDATEKQDVKMDISDNHVILICINFSASGAGLAAPAQIAVIDQKKVYFIFWSYLDGSIKNKPKVRRVTYTLYLE